jgi:hypothetical protein
MPRIVTIKPDESHIAKAKMKVIKDIFGEIGPIHRGFSEWDSHVTKAVNLIDAAAYIGHFSKYEARRLKDMITGDRSLLSANVLTWFTDWVDEHLVGHDEVVEYADASETIWGRNNNVAKQSGDETHDVD